MQNIDEGLLTQALLDLWQNKGNALNSDPIALEKELRRAIARSSMISQPSESRRVTILLSDLRGFTATTERHSALAMVEALNRYLEKMSEIILHHGGSIDKFMGDSIMALFGAPDPMQNEAHSLRGQILLSEKIYVRAQDFIQIGHINEVFVKGKKSVVRMVELLGVTSEPAVQVPVGDIRIGPRVEVDMPLNFQLIEGKTVLPDKIYGRIVDISYGGMYIQSQTELPLFCDIKMMLSLSLLVQEHADVYGKVLRMAAVADGFEYRIEFTSIDVQAQSALKEFVDRLVEIK